jgi:hypothetical protein
MKYVTCFRILAAALAMVLVAPQSMAEEQLDRLDLDATSVTGNQELPKVLYIVPWKQSGIGELDGKPVDSLLDEALAPLDREVFQRQVRYFEQLYVNETSSVTESD